MNNTAFPMVTDYPTMPEAVQKYRKNPVAHDDTYYLYEGIEEPLKHLDLIQALHSATENDVINIRICCYGGQIDSMITIIHAILGCGGTVIGYLDGDAYSAGAMIFLACHYQVVSKYSAIMLHDGSTGTYGKMNEGKHYYDFETNRLERICKDILIKVFTDEEIDEILKGTDRYLQSDELIVRLTKYQQEQEKLAEEQEEDV